MTHLEKRQGYFKRMRRLRLAGRPGTECKRAIRIKVPIEGERIEEETVRGFLYDRARKSPRGNTGFTLDRKTRTKNDSYIREEFVKNSQRKTFSVEGGENRSDYRNTNKLKKTNFQLRDFAKFHLSRNEVLKKNRGKDS